MTQGQSVLESRQCPRCGGLMAKPLGSTLYWHVDNNHPRCEITNLIDAPVVVPPAEGPPNETPKHNPRKK